MSSTSTSISTSSPVRISGHNDGVCNVRLSGPQFPGTLMKNCFFGPLTRTMDDKDKERDVKISRAAEKDNEMDLEEAVAAVTLSSTIRRTPSPNSTLSNHSSRVYSNSHHTQVRRSTDNREEDLLLEFQENLRRQSDSRVRMQDPLAQTACCDIREEDELSRQTSSNSQQGEPLQSIAQPLENVSLRSTTTCTPQQESCDRHFDDPPDGRLENATQPRRPHFVNVERIRSK